MKLCPVARTCYITLNAVHSADEKKMIVAFKSFSIKCLQMPKHLEDKLMSFH